jgi:hypothetical protein
MQRVYLRGRENVLRYSNEESKAQGRDYKDKFALLPSVDHVGDRLGDADFKICGLRTNDTKGRAVRGEGLSVSPLVLR